MSLDEAFAAQMWSWPDPVLKRDPMGRVLFVNAAFLIAYGGQVDDWHGNTVMGWPAPTTEPYPNRFETQVPSGQGETVYDWIEHFMMDGNAMAVARDVTALKAAAIAVSTPALAATQMASAQAPATQMTTTQAAQAQAPAHAPHQAPLQAGANPIPAAQAVPAQTEYAQVPHMSDQHAPAQPAAQSPAQPMTDLGHPSSFLQADPHATAQVAAQNNPDMAQPAPHMSNAPHESLQSATGPADHERSDHRDFERRALPIESDAAILGNNWRDAVIAKAVGVESDTAQTEPGDSPSNSVMSKHASETVHASPIPAADASRVLLAEDNAINALLTRTLLEAEGCIVDVVEDGALAVDAVKQSNYDMIFMDMRMPNMDGLEATRKIRGLSERSRTLPIVALTANAFDDDRNACFDSGMNDFMTKPVSAEELSDMVKTWTQSKSETDDSPQNRMAS